MTVPLPPPLPSPSQQIPAVSWLRRHRHLTVPAALPAGMAIAGLAAAHFRSARGELITASAVAVAAMCFAAPHKWDRRAEQWYARLSAAAIAGWLCVTAWLGIGMWTGLALLAVSLGWGLPWWWHKRPRAVQRGRGAAGEWDAWWQHHALGWGLVGSGVAEVTTKGSTDTLMVKLWAGRQVIGDVDRAVPLIESALAGYVPHGGIRLARVHADPSRVLVHLRRSDPLAAAVRWDPSMVPLSITEPAVIGQREDGTWKRVRLLANWFVLGATRTGKSNEMSLFLTVITGVPDAVAWVIAMKGGRAVRPWIEAIDWPATDIGEARLLLRAAWAEVEARGRHAYDGREQLEPSPEVPAIFVMIDEANGVTSEGNGDTECANLLARIASQGPGVGVYVCVSTQYGGLAESVRTEQTRGNLLCRICFAVAEARHGQFALADWAKLDPSKLAEPGMFYAKLGKDAPSEPFRAPEMHHDLVRAISASNAAMPRVPLSLYASDWQHVYDTRWSRLPEVFRSLRPGIAAAPPAGVATSAAPAPEPVLLADAAGVADRLARIEADIMSVPDVGSLSGLPLPSEASLSGDLRRRKLRFARDVMTAAAGGDWVTPDQLVQHTGLSRSWVMAQLRDLVAAEAIEKGTRGKYRGVPGVSVWDVMQALDATRDQLLSEARSA